VDKKISTKKETNHMTLASIILAAGQGTRMHSKLPKVAHKIAGKPMIWHALQAVAALVEQPPVIVVGYGAEDVKKSLQEDVVFALQEEQLGTGHAVACVRDLLKAKSEVVLVTFGDMPLLRKESIEKLIRLHQGSNSPVTMTSFIGDEARGFGRVLRNQAGHVIGIVEQVDATPEQLAIREYNVSAYCFNADWLWDSLEQIPISPKGEYYLTDVVGLAVTQGYDVEALVLDDPEEAIGINTRVHLATAEKIFRKRINEKWMLAGVTLINPDATYIEPGVTIGKDSVIFPNTYLCGSTNIGEDCEIGPDTTILDSKIGKQVIINFSVIEHAEIADRVTMGPFCHLRKGAILKEGVHLGNFGEVKDSCLGAGTKMGHFSYIGNAVIGENVNIGAGTITCNYDGKNKNPTEIGNDVFIGSDTMLVAPVKIGDRSRTGAGSVVTHDVPPDTLVYGVPAKEKKNLEKSD